MVGRVFGQVGGWVDTLTDRKIDTVRQTDLHMGEHTEGQDLQ